MQKRKTIQKQLIFDAVKQLDIHATAEDVYAFIVQTNPTISKATVYRNLASMAEDGELKSVGILGGATHYDHNTHDHYHFLCDTCNKVFDIDGDFSMIENLEKSVSKVNPYIVSGFSLSFNGTCETCK